jgi:hypothetical protein
MHANSGRRAHVEDLVVDLDPRAALNEDVNLLTAAGVTMTYRQTPTRAEPEIADADVFAAEDPTQNPQLEFSFGELEPRGGPVRSIPDRQYLRSVHESRLRPASRR